MARKRREGLASGRAGMVSFAKPHAAGPEAPAQPRQWFFFRRSGVFRASAWRRGSAGLGDEIVGLGT